MKVSKIVVVFKSVPLNLYLRQPIIRDHLTEEINTCS